MKKLAFVLPLILAACTQAPSNWQYKVLYVPAAQMSSDKETSVKIDETALAAAGSEGWELVSSYEEYETAFPNFSQDQKIVTGIESNVRPTQVVLIFKKPIAGK